MNGPLTIKTKGMSTKPKFTITPGAKYAFWNIQMEHDRGVIRTPDFIMVPDPTSLKGYILAPRANNLQFPNN